MINLVKELRQLSGAPIGECSAALKATGDLESALTYLQEKGKVIGKLDKPTEEGLLFSYIHANKIGVILEVKCTTDFTARTEEFSSFGEAIALQIAAMNPKYLEVRAVPLDTLMHQRDIFKAQLQNEGKPEKAWPNIIDGKMTKWLAENCLSLQESVVLPGKTIEELRLALSSKVGENIVIRRFIRWELGQ